MRGMTLNIGVAAFSLAITALSVVGTPAAAAAELAASSQINDSVRANFLKESASADARRLADWIVDSHDNDSLPFAIVDKIAARVFVFGSEGMLRGAAAALLGLAVGDDSVPGIGDRPLAAIRPEERTTPAGRFVAAPGEDLETDILWIDYDAAISMHRVITTSPKERRLQRLATPTPLDNRISYGCINVPAKFYDSIVHPAFLGTGIVYVLPETRSLGKEFPAYYDVMNQLSGGSAPEVPRIESARSSTSDSGAIIPSTE